MLPQTITADARPLRTYSTAHGELMFGRRCLIMGILNITPDSFSDGGQYEDFDAAVNRAVEIEKEGADVIDIGGESTRPGNDAVPADEQIRRVVPVIQEARARDVHAPISIDTRLASVAAAALDAGADMVNDVSGARHDSAMPSILAERGVPFVVMHMLGAPATMQAQPQYDDVVFEVGAFFDERAQALSAAGVDVNGRMLVDPGIGFGKNLEHNLALLRAAASFGRRWPVVVGASRKRFLGEILHEPSADGRLFGTAATVAHAALTGVDMVRVHEVKAMRQVVEVSMELRMQNQA